MRCAGISRRRRSWSSRCAALCGFFNRFNDALQIDNELEDAGAAQEQPAQEQQEQQPAQV